MKLRREWLPLTALLLMLAGSLYARGRVLEQLPVHWGLDGQPDRYGGRLEALGIFPLVGLLLYASLWCCRVRSHSLSRTRSLPGPFCASCCSASPRCTSGSSPTTCANLAVPRLAGLVVGVILMGVGNLLPKAQPSRWLGVRTPWTFGSKESWYRSQRAGGWVMTLSGLAFFVTSLVTASATALFVVVVATLLAVAGLLLYSYLVWRGDDRREPSL